MRYLTKTSVSETRPNCSIVWYYRRSSVFMEDLYPDIVNYTDKNTHMAINSTADQIKSVNK